MKPILVLIAALSVASSQVSEKTETVLPQTVTATATSPLLGICTQQDLIDFVFELPNPLDCALAFSTAFDPFAANNTMAVNEALESLCTRDCGGRYANFLETTCDDGLSAETIRIYCTRTDGSSALGDYCRYSASDMVDPSLQQGLTACDNNTVDSCTPGCRRALNRLREQVGCCYQHLYNNTVLTKAFFSSGLLTVAEYLGLVKLNNATSNPWITCDIRPPRRCRGQPFEPPPTPTGPPPTPTGPTPTPTGPTSLCTPQDHVDFFSELPNPQECGLAFGSIFDATLANNSMAYDEALESLCTRDCGGRYADFLETTCDDEIGAETIRIYCTPTDGSSTLGDYCRYSAGDVADPSLLYGLNACHNYTFDNPCAPGCRRALDRLMEEVGCCYQQLYNNTAYIEGLLGGGFITVDEYLGLVQLNNPTSNPWTACNIRPPRRCRGEPFQPEPEPDVCTEQDQIDFVSSLPNATTCGFGLLNIFTPPTNDSTALPIAIDSVCNNECGGAYSNFLENQCRDDLAAAALRVYCTATNGTANVGSHCRYAIGDQIDISLLTDLFACANNSAAQPCVPGCRSALIRLKDELGCCYQNAYNDTEFNTILLNSDAIDLTEYVLRLSLGNPDGNPWTQCDISPPDGCPPPPFVPPKPLCTLDDQIEFASRLPNAEVCGPSLATVFSPTNNTRALTTALENVCNRECGGRYANYLRSECGQDLTSETLRLHCTPTDDARDYCRFAAGDILDLSVFTDLEQCNITVDNPCSSACRRTLVRLRNQVGCCYQNIYNNTFYYTLLLSGGYITHTEFLGFQELNNPFYNPWDACNVTVPERCRGNPFPRDMGCPGGTYRTNNRMCRPCPDNTDLSRSGGDATICPCVRGYYRAENEGPSDRCSAPPDACRDINIRRRGSQNITLSWSRPRNTGRDDFYYIIEYSDGRTTGRHALVEEMGRIEESIGGLRPDTEYTFTVTVENGVSYLDERPRNELFRQCVISTRTEEGMPSPPADIEAFCAAVAWRFPRSPNGRIMRYDVQLRLPGRRQTVMLDSRFDGTYVAVPEDYQLYGATVRVRARTMAGPGAWTEMVDLGCKEITETTCPPCDCPTTAPPPPVGVYFTLGDVAYRNNSIVPVSSIGEGDDALLCRTDNADCCSDVSNRFGEFYYPGGRQVPVNRAGEAFYRNRGDSLIRLNRRSGGTPVTGRFRCEIRDASGTPRNIYITLVDHSTVTAPV